MPHYVAGTLMVVSFHPSPKPLGRKIAELALKDPRPLTVWVDGREFRLPRALAGGPLVISAPASLAWTGDRSARPPAPTDVSFSEDGSVVFGQIALDDALPRTP